MVGCADCMRRLWIELCHLYERIELGWLYERFELGWLYERFELCWLYERFELGWLYEKIVIIVWTHTIQYKHEFFIVALTP